ncbi:MAG TPA: DUF2797 domain-containing protein [Candidatus Norongarragalinales archaeon]|nr:DUF2797 domain-containing protein [Candidatus Norongarragalinales archaeon]
MLIQRFSYQQGVPVLFTEKKEYRLEKGENIQIALSEELHCTGYSRNKEHHPCPKNSKGKKQCIHCSKEDDWLACLRCDGSTCLQFNPDLKDDCFGQEYAVYLASFGQNVKAGISKKERVQKRWIEQGADFACIVFEDVNGQKARIIESELFRKGLLSRLTVSMKMDLPKPEPDALTNVMESANFKDVQKSYEKHATLPKVESLSENYPDVLEGKRTDYLQGEVIGWKGPLLFLKTNETRVFALPDAVGHKVLENTLAAYF